MAKFDYWLTDDGLLLLAGWARDGLTDEQIAQNMGINKATLYRWKERFCDICEALKKSKEVVDTEVENALFKKAMGYDYTEEVSERRFNRETGQWEMVVTKTMKKHAAPDTVAAIFWLKNRRPEEWREKAKEPAAESDGVEVINDAPTS